MCTLKLHSCIDLYHLPSNHHPGPNDRQHVVLHWCYSRELLDVFNGQDICYSASMTAVKTIRDKTFMKCYICLMQTTSCNNTSKSSSKYDMRMKLHQKVAKQFTLWHTEGFYKTVSMLTSWWAQQSPLLNMVECYTSAQAEHNNQELKDFFQNIPVLLVGMPIDHHLLVFQCVGLPPTTVFCSHVFCLSMHFFLDWNNFKLRIRINSPVSGTTVRQMYHMSSMRPGMAKNLFRT